MKLRELPLSTHLPIRNRAYQRGARSCTDFKTLRLKSISRENLNYPNKLCFISSYWGTLFIVILTVCFKLGTLGLNQRILFCHAENVHESGILVKNRSLEPLPSQLEPRGEHSINKNYLLNKQHHKAISHEIGRNSTYKSEDQGVTNKSFLGQVSLLKNERYENLKNFLEYIKLYASRGRNLEGGSFNSRAISNKQGHELYHHGNPYRNVSSNLQEKGETTAGRHNTEKYTQHTRTKEETFQSNERHTQVGHLQHPLKDEITTQDSKVSPNYAPKESTTGTSASVQPHSFSAVALATQKNYVATAATTAPTTATATTFNTHSTTTAYFVNGSTSDDAKNKSRSYTSIRDDEFGGALAPNAQPEILIQLQGSNAGNVYSWPTSTVALKKPDQRGENHPLAYSAHPNDSIDTDRVPFENSGIPQAKLSGASEKGYKEFSNFQMSLPKIPEHAATSLLKVESISGQDSMPAPVTQTPALVESEPWRSNDDSTTKPTIPTNPDFTVAGTQPPGGAVITASVSSTTAPPHTTTATLNPALASPTIPAPPSSSAIASPPLLTTPEGGMVASPTIPAPPSSSAIASPPLLTTPEGGMVASPTIPAPPSSSATASPPLPTTPEGGVVASPTSSEVATSVAPTLPTPSVDSKVVVPTLTASPGPSTAKIVPQPKMPPADATPKLTPAEGAESTEDSTLKSLNDVKVPEGSGSTNEAPLNNPLEQATRMSSPGIDQAQSHPTGIAASRHIVGVDMIPPVDAATMDDGILHTDDEAQDGSKNNLATSQASLAAGIVPPLGSSPLLLPAHRRRKDWPFTYVDQTRIILNGWWWPVWTGAILAFILDLLSALVNFAYIASFFPKGLYGSSFYLAGGSWMVAVSTLGLLLGGMVGGFIGNSAASTLLVGGSLMVFFLSIVLLGRSGAWLGALGGGGIGISLGLFFGGAYFSIIVGGTSGFLLGLVVGFAPWCRNLKINEAYIRKGLKLSRQDAGDSPSDDETKLLSRATTSFFSTQQSLQDSPRNTSKNLRSYRSVAAKSGHEPSKFTSYGTRGAMRHSDTEAGRSKFFSAGLQRPPSHAVKLRAAFADLEPEGSKAHVLNKSKHVDITSSAEISDASSSGNTSRTGA